MKGYVLFARIKKWGMLVLFWLLVVSPVSYGASIENILEKANSKIIDPYEQEQSIQVKCSGWSKKNWFVSLENGEVQIKDVYKSDNQYVDAETLPFEVAKDPVIESPNQNKTVFPVSDGYLIALNAGEWGGSLWWYSKDGKSKKVVLPYDLRSPFNSFVNEFMPTREGLFLLTGAAHLSSDEGGVVKLENINQERWQLTQWIEFNSSVEKYYQLDSDNFLILSNKKVALFSLNGKSVVLYEPLNINFSLRFGGNSIVQDKAGNIYVGGRYKVIRLKPVLGGYKEEWIIPEYCEWDVESNGVCQCRD